MTGQLLDGARLAIGTFSIVPVKPPAAITPARAAIAMALAPAMGAAVGAAAAGISWLVWRATSSPLLAGIAAVTMIAVATRALHLDGLADTADGLGSGKRGEDALAVMRRSDIGPFGVVTLMLLLLTNAVVWGELVANGYAVWGVVGMACGRLATLVCCARGVPAATDHGLGAAVASNVPWLAAISVIAIVTALGAIVATPFAAIAAVLAAIVASAVVVWRCLIRWGGITGDVIGAAIEIATTAALCALLIAAL